MLADMKLTPGRAWAKALHLRRIADANDVAIPWRSEQLETQAAA